MIDELERIWKEATGTQIEVLSESFPRGTEESHEETQSV
jgi:hypothetical protein